MFNKHTLRISYLSICAAAQITVSVGMALSAMAVSSGMYDGILYLSFIFFSVFVVLILNKKDFAWDFGIEASLTFLLLSAVFKSTIYDNSPVLASHAAIALLVIAVMVKIFPQELPRMYKKIAVGVGLLKPWGTPIAIVLITAFVFVPDLKAVLAEIFIGEQAHHMDFFLMSPGLACLHGGLPYVDVISQYGVGVPFILSKLCRLFGGFDYLPVVRMVMIFAIFYFIVFYCFVRAWLGSALLAFAAFLVCFRLQMFHYGVSPLCLIYPSSTPIRFGLDLLWLWLLWRHLKSGRNIFLFMASAYSGAAVYYMTSSGMAVVVTFYFYLAALCISNLRKVEKTAKATFMIAAVLPVFIGFLLFWMTLGGHVFKGLFWHNLIEYLTFFAHGHAGGVLPMHESLKYRNFWVAFMAFIIPLIYVATAIGVGALIYLKRIDRKYFLAVTIAVYGLVNYQYFVVRSAMTSYYLSAVPFVLICAFWVHIGLKQLSVENARRARFVCVLLAFYALVTNHNYISYPNVFNFSPNPLVDSKVAQHFPDRQGYFHHLVKHIKESDKVAFNAAGDGDEHLATEDSFKTDQELVDFVSADYDFTIDANLISTLTKAHEPAAVVSSFETKILMQAGRAPFFYHTPLLTSQPMRVRYFPSDAAHSPNFLKDTLAQLEDKKPKYIFIENVFLQDIYPATYNDSHKNVLTIVGYIRQNYVPIKKGQYLTAMEIGATHRIPN